MQTEAPNQGTTNKDSEGTSHSKDEASNSSCKICQENKPVPWEDLMEDECPDISRLNL